MVSANKACGLIVAAGLALALASCARQAGYDTFEDCVLEEVDSAQNQAAVRVVQDACRSKFPPTEAEQAARMQAFQKMTIDAQAAADAANAAARAASEASASE